MCVFFLFFYFSSLRARVPQMPSTPCRGSLVDARSFECVKKGGCAFGYGVVLVPVGVEMADLRRRPHQWHPRVVYSELCTTQGNLTV